MCGVLPGRARAEPALPLLPRAALVPLVSEPVHLVRPPPPWRQARPAPAQL